MKSPELVTLNYRSYLWKIPLLVFGIFLLMSFVDQPASAYFKFDFPRAVRHWAKRLTVLGQAEWYFGLSLLLALFSHWKCLRAETVDKDLWRELRAIGCVSFSAFIVVGLLNGVFKSVVGRQRPIRAESYDPWVFVPFNLDYRFQSFPSGHTQTVFTLLALVRQYYGKAFYAVLAFAVLIGITRVMVHNHFVSDVVMGAFWGWLITHAYLHALHVWWFSGQFSQKA